MFKLISIIFFIALSVSTASLSSAEVYKWTNDDGSLGVTNDLTRVPDKYRDKAEKIDFQSDAIDKDRAYEEVIIPDSGLSKDPKSDDYRNPERRNVPWMRDGDDRYRERLSRREREYEDDEEEEGPGKRKRGMRNRKIDDNDMEDEESGDEEGAEFRRKDRIVR